jgi:formylglycine-generating enzyme required for sulfatase activity
LEIKKEGYQPFQTKITPRPGFPKELRVALTKLVPKKPVIPGVIKAANGYELKLIRPGSFTMGASRREQGRRSNETLRKVTLQRPFYMGVKEVTNKEFKEFLSAHSSGSLQGNSLDLGELPVVQVTWDQAALFCNWLSAKESLPLSYIKLNGEVVAANTLRTGYRLPTEAEWEYAARFNNNKAPMKYPWGNTFPPPPKSGNFADISAKDLLANYLAAYNDGYLSTAHPGAFRPNALGLYDLGGNVAEWCHDYYTIYSYSDQKTYVDPLGPKQGKHRVIKGSSWKDGSISELRLSYRDYSQDKRNDLGFRIVRYLKDRQEK